MPIVQKRMTVFAFVYFYDIVMIAQRLCIVVKRQGCGRLILKWFKEMPTISFREINSKKRDFLNGLRERGFCYIYIYIYMYIYIFEI